MANTRKSAPAILSQIDLEISDFDDKLYKTTYYVLRNKIGYELSRNAKKDNLIFDWSNFKEQTFIECFGSIKEPKYSLSDLLYYIERKFGMTRQDILDYNKQTYQRYQEYQTQNNLAT